MKLRDSNFELFRIVAMMGIIAWHALWYSGLATRAYADPWNWSNALLLVLGAWGKTGINCFVLITGYFMCQRKLTIGRFLKVIGLTEFYAFLVLGLSVALGWQQFSWKGIGETARLFISGINESFVSSYIGLLALVPILNAGIARMSVKMLTGVSGVLLLAFCVLPSIGVKISLGEIPWFVTLYFIAALVRREELKNLPVGVRAIWKWGFGLVLVLVGAIASMALGAGLNPRMPGRNMIYYWVFPDAKVLAFGVAFCAFVVFKKLQIESSKIINTIGGATFGIYLLHDGALGTFRERFWEFLINSKNYGGGLILMRYVIAVSGVFCICAMIDIIRKQMLSIFRKCGALRTKHPTMKGENG